MRFKAILILIMLLTTLCSCAYTEPDAVFTVTAVGFSADGGESVLTLQIIEANKSEGVVPRTFEVEGNGQNNDAALKTIKTKLSKKASFEHCQLIVLSNEIAEEEISDALELCMKLEIPLRTKLVCSSDIQKLFSNEELSVGEDIVSLLKQNYKEFGFGGNTALFEIKTAVLTNGGNFALPHITVVNNAVKLEGLCEYKNKKPIRLLNLEQSINYAKEVLG